MEGDKYVIDKDDIKVYQLEELEMIKAGQLKDGNFEENKSHFVELGNKEDHDRFMNSATKNVYFKKNYVKTAMAKGGNIRNAEERRILEEYSSIDLSNKRDSIIENSKNQLVDSAGKYKRYYPRENQELIDDSRNPENVGRNLNATGSYSNQGYLIRKHLNSSDEIDYEEIIEPQQMYIKDRNTQTPIRETSNQGIQCINAQGSMMEYNQIRMHSQNLSSNKKSIDADYEGERLPFSTIKKRDGTDTESQISKFENTPLKDKDFEEIINMIKYNEKIQQQIMNDPVLRDKFIEKYNEMRHSGSDQTLPSSFWSKGGDNRRTHANTYNYNTPLKSDDYDRGDTHRSPRFTQFTNTDYIGEEGKIYDDAVMFGRRERETNVMKNSDSDISKPHSEVNYGNEILRQQDNQPKKEYYGNTNFSFLEEQKRKSMGDKNKKQDYTHKLSHTVDVNDNENDLLIDGEENIERNFLNDGNIKNIPATKKRSTLGSRSKSQKRTDQPDMIITSKDKADKGSVSNILYHQVPNKPIHKHKHSNSQYNYDSSNIHPGYEQDSVPSSKHLEEMKISKSNIYDIENDSKSMSERARRTRKYRKANFTDLQSPNLQINSQYINQLSNDREEDVPYHSDESPNEESKQKHSKSDMSGKNIGTQLKDSQKIVPTSVREHTYTADDSKLIPDAASDQHQHLYEVSDKDRITGPQKDSGVKGKLKTPFPDQHVHKELSDEKSHQKLSDDEEMKHSKSHKNELKISNKLKHSNSNSSKKSDSENSKKSDSKQSKKSDSNQSKKSESNKKMSSSSKSFKFGGMMNSPRQTYKSKEHKSYYVENAKKYHPSTFAAIDLRDSNMKEQSSKIGNKNTPGINEKEGDFDTPQVELSKKSISSKNEELKLANSALNQSKTSPNFNDNELNIDVSIPHTSRVTNTGRLDQHSQPDRGARRSINSESNLLEGSINKIRSIRGRSRLYANFKETRDKLRSSEKSSDSGLVQRLQAEISKPLISDTNQVSIPSYINTREGDRKLNLTDINQRDNDYDYNQAEKSPKPIYRPIYSHINISNEDNKYEVNDNENSTEKLEIHSTSHKNDEIDSVTTEENKFKPTSIKERYSRNSSDDKLAVKKGIADTKSQEVSRGDQDDETLKFKYSQFKDENEHEEFDKTQNMSNVLKEIMHDDVDNDDNDNVDNDDNDNVDYNDNENVDYNDNVNVDNNDNDEANQRKEVNLKKSTDNIAIESDDSTLKPINKHDNVDYSEQSHHDDSKLLDEDFKQSPENIQDPSYSAEDAIREFEEEADVFHEIPSQPPQKVIEFVKRQSSTHEMHISGVKSPMKKAQHVIIDNIDNFEDQFDNLDDEIEDDFKDQTLKIVSMQSEAFDVSKIQAKVIPHPEHMVVHGNSDENEDEEIKSENLDNDQNYQAHRDYLSEEDNAKIGTEERNKSMKGIFTVDMIQNRPNDEIIQIDSKSGDSSPKKKPDFEHVQISQKNLSDDNINPSLLEKNEGFTKSKTKDSTQKIEPKSFEPIYKPKFIRHSDEDLRKLSQERHAKRIEELKSELNIGQKSISKKYSKSDQLAKTLDPKGSKNLDSPVQSDKQSSKRSSKQSDKQISKDSDKQSSKHSDKQSDKQSSKYNDKQSDKHSSKHSVGHKSSDNEDIESDHHSSQHSQNLSIQSVKQQKQKLEDDIKKLDDEIAKAYERSHLHVEPEKERLQENYEDQEQLESDENVNDRPSYKNPSIQDTTTTVVHSTKFKDLQNDVQIDVNAHEQKSEHEDNLPEYVIDESPLYYNSKGTKFGPQYYDANDQDIYTVNVKSESKQPEIQSDENEGKIDPEIQEIEDKYLNQKDDSDSSKPKYKGPLSKYLESNSNTQPSKLKSSGEMTLKEFKPLVMQEIEGDYDDDIKSQNDRDDKKYLNVDTKLQIQHQAKSEIEDKNVRDYYSFSDRSNQAHKGSRHPDSDKMNSDEMMSNTELEASKTRQRQIADSSNFEASFGPKSQKKSGFVLDDNIHEMADKDVQTPEEFILKKHPSAQQDILTGRFGVGDKNEQKFSDGIDAKYSELHGKKHKPTVKKSHKSSKHTQKEEVKKMKKGKIHRKQVADSSYTKKQKKTYEASHTPDVEYYESTKRESDKHISRQEYRKKSSNISNDNSNMFDNFPYFSGIEKDGSKINVDTKFSIDSVGEMNKTPDHHLDDSFNYKKIDYLHDQYHRVHQNVVNRLSGSKSEKKGKMKQTKKTNPKLTKSDIKVRSLVDNFYDEGRHQIDQIEYDDGVHPINKTDYDEGISSILEYDYTLLDPDEPIIIDNGLMKFHPGFSINYVSRWVQATRTVIRFYKNYYHSVCSFRRPLAAIPAQYIKEVKKCKIKPRKSNLARVTDRFNKNPYDQHQFEIVLKEDYEAIYNLNKKKKELEDLKYELELIQRLDFQNKLTKKYKEYRKKCRHQRVDSTGHNRSFKNFAEFEQNEIISLSKSHPRVEAYSVLVDNEFDRSSLKLNKSHENLRKMSVPQDHNNLSVISRGRHRMLEASGDKSVISIDENFVHSSCSRSRSKQKKKDLLTTRNVPFSKRSKTPFDSTQIVDGHLMPIRVNRPNRNGKSTFREGVNSKPRKRAKCEWSKRETDWFKYERRFILSTKTKEERKLWMKTIQDIIQQ